MRGFEENRLTAMIYGVMFFFIYECIRIVMIRTFHSHAIVFFRLLTYYVFF